MRSKFDQDLEKLNEELIEMGNLIESRIETAVSALVNQDVDLAKRVATGDKEVNDKERDIEDLCLKLILQQQPVAKDLRLISSALKMITDMERIGDQAADISELTIRMANEKYFKELIDIPQMAEETIYMVREAINAFVKRDVDKAVEIIYHDDKVDKLFDMVKNELIEYIRDQKYSSEQSVDFILIAKYFERIGDHAQNIAEWVYYAITGEHFSWS